MRNNNNTLNQNQFVNSYMSKHIRAMYPTVLVLVFMMGSFGVSWGQGMIGFGSNCDVSTPLCENTSTYPEILSCPPDVTCNSGILEFCWFVQKPNSTDFIPVAGTNGSANYRTVAGDFNVTPPNGTYKFRRYFKCMDDCPATISDPWMNCSNEVMVVVNAAPNAGAISGTQNICSNGSTQLSTTGSGGTWSINPTSVATINSSGIVSGVSEGTATVSYTVTGTGGCSDAIATYTITVTAAPNAGNISGTQNICSNGSTQLSTTGSGGTWSITPTSVATINSSGLVAGVSAGTANVSYTVTGTGGCSNAVATFTIRVNPLPNASFSLPSEVCQDGDVDFVISGSVGTTPFNFTYNGINSTSDNNGTSTIKIPTNNPGEIIYALTQVQDANGCSKDLQEEGLIRVWKNPEAKFDIIGINSEFNTFFNLDASSTLPGSNSNLTYFWTFDPPLLQQGNLNPIPTSPEKILEKLFGSKGDINQKFNLKVSDQNNCMNETDKNHPWGAAVNCQVSLGNNNKFCTKENIFSDSISLTTNIASVDSDDEFTFNCENCDDVSPKTIKPNKKDFKIKLTVNNVGGQKLIKLKTTINQNENGGCNNVESDIDILIQGAGLIEKASINYKSDICVGDVSNSGLKIINIVPSNNVEIEYENGSIKNKVTSINGSVQIPLDVTNSGSKIIKLLKITNNNNNTGCSRDLLDFEFSYTVTECRQPKLEVGPFIQQNTYCLNQSGITFKATDRNNYRGFNPISKTYSWKILAPNGQQLASSPSDEIQSRDSSVVLFIKKSKFLTYDSIQLVGTIASNYQGISPFVDEFSYKIRIDKSKEAPNRSTIARYPGHVYFLEDTISNLCVQWGLANDNTFNNNSILPLNTSTNPKISQSGFAVFGNDILTGELESLKKYLWADTWFKTGPTCDFATAECITRTYYNASLPPKGAPRSTPETYQAVIYPNPNTGQFTLSLQGNWADTFTVDLLDYTRRQVAQLGKIDKALFKTESTIDIQGVLPGLYLLRVVGTDGLARTHKVTIY